MFDQSQWNVRNLARCVIRADGCVSEHRQTGPVVSFGGNSGIRRSLAIRVCSCDVWRFPDRELRD